MEQKPTSPVRMTTRGMAQNYAEMQSSNLGASSVSFNASVNSSHISNSDDDHHSDFTMDTTESAFRTPAASIRRRKRRVFAEENTAPSESLNTVRRGRGRGAARGRPLRRASTANVQEDADESSLFSMVKNCRSLDVVIEKWIEEYERHPDNAMVQLHQFFISSCGCKGIISSVMLQTMEYSEIIQQISDQFDENVSDYPLIMSGPQWRRFKQNFSEFVMRLISKCKSSYVFDQRLMDGVIQLLTGLADSQIRAFRHTATFIAMRLSSALVDLALELVSLREKNIKQVETEKTKLKSHGVNDRLDVLINKKAEIDEKMEDVRQMLQYIFKSVFVHRYRDIVPDIRSICINELGQWMSVYPDYFLEDSYLKYIGWSLYDKVGDVRLKCVLALISLYERPELTAKLELFTNKFKNRIVCMVMDKDFEVAVRACQLLTEIYKVYPSSLSPSDCVPIYELVYSIHRGLAQAAGEFLNTKVFQNAYNEQMGRANENAKQLIVDLIQFYMEGDCHDHPAYLVDSLIDINPMLKDWKTMTELLMSGEADRFDSELIDVLVCSIKQACTGECPVGRSHNVRKGTATAVKDVRVLQEEKSRMSEILIPQLPALLNRFIADRDKVANLVTIALHFQLEMYLASRLEKDLDDLMTVLESVIEKHADDEVLHGVAQVMAYFSTNVAVAQHTETHLLKMLDGLALQLRHSVQRFLRETTTDDEDNASMLASFRKVTAFAKFIDLKKWQLWEPALSVLSNGDEKQVTRDIGEKAVQLLYLTIFWDLNRLVHDQESNKAEALRKLRKRKDVFVKTLTSILANGASGVENAYLCLVDTLIMLNNYPDEPLEVRLSPEDVRIISMFVVDNVFVDENEDEQSMNQQTQVELMHKRRRLLTQFCKMILHGILYLHDASLVLQFYTKYYVDYGDILKTLLNRCRDINKIGCAKAIATSLCHYYDDLRRNSPGWVLDPNSDDFASVRDLAKRFANSFGSEQIKNREALAVIHRDGIRFAMKKDEIIENSVVENLPFLEVLIEFSGKLLRPDKLSVLRYLEKHAEGLTNEEPYVLYKASLQERNDENAVVRSGPTRGRGRGRGRGRITPNTNVSGDE